MTSEKKGCVVAGLLLSRRGREGTSEEMQKVRREEKLVVSRSTIDERGREGAKGRRGWDLGSRKGW